MNGEHESTEERIHIIINLISADCVALVLLSAKVAKGGMEVGPVPAGDAGKRLIQVSAQLRNRAGLFWIVASGLNSAPIQRGARKFKSTDIVPLLVLKGNRRTGDIRLGTVF